MTTELGKTDDWLEFTYGGKDFAIEVVDALDLVRQVDVQHRDDATYCPACRFTQAFQTNGDPRKPINCPKCDEGKLALNPDVLRDVGEAVKQRFGLDRFSLNAAMEFRSAVLNAMDAAKKKLEDQRASAIGMESTPEVGVI